MGGAMITDDLYQAYLACLLAGDKAGCRRIVADLLGAAIEIKELYTDLFQRSLYEIGDLWECHEVSVAVEHLATAITDSLLHLVYPILFAQEHSGRSAIVACVPNEYHQIGGKMVADIFELHGWNGYFLGANTPSEDLMQMVKEKQTEIVGLSVSIHTNLANLPKTLDLLSENCSSLRILVGGQAFRYGGSDILTQYPNVRHVPSLDELELLLQAS